MEDEPAEIVVPVLSDIPHRPYIPILIEPVVVPQMNSDLAATTVSDIIINVKDDSANKIKNILATNQVEDLSRFIAKRAILNKCTMYFMYGSYVFQSLGIFVTTVATGYNLPELTWVGIGLNMVSALMIVFEKINVSVSTKFMKDIQAIKAGTYVDEGVLVNDIKKDEDSKK